MYSSILVNKIIMFCTFMLPYILLHLYYIRAPFKLAKLSWMPLYKY